MKKIIIFLLVICVFSLSINAEVINPEVQINDYFIGQQFAPVNGYINLRFRPSTDNRLWTTVYNNQRIFLGVKTSYILPNTFYRFSFKPNAFSGETANTTSGTIDINNDTFLQFIPQTYLENGQYITNDAAYESGILETLWESTKIPSDYVTAYWDHTLDTYYVLFYIPESFYNDHTELFMQTLLVYTLGLNSSGASMRVEFTQVTQAEIDDPIYNVLQEIKNNLAASGGGLSEEDIKNAVQDALDDHDESLIDKVENALQDFADQVSDTFGSVVASTENIKSSLSNFSNIFSYTGTDCVLSFPEARNPMTGNSLLWARQDVDIGQTYSAFPSALTSALKVFLDALIAMAVINEVISIVQLTTFGGRSDG